MKKDFFDYMDILMEKYDDIYLILAGLGYPRSSEFLAKYPDRCINTEAAEQTALDICVGLAYAGKTPVIYTITPFLYRGFETIRTLIDHERLNVVLIGAGRDDDYSRHDGFSHDAKDDKIFMPLFKNIISRWPENEQQMKKELQLAITGNAPTYINLKR